MIICVQSIAFGMYEDDTRHSFEKYNHIIESFTLFPSRAYTHVFPSFFKPRILESVGDEIEWGCDE